MRDPFEMVQKENNVLIKIDEFEENIKIIDKLTKQYDELKKEIKEAMLKVGKENNLTQIKWVTPKGIKITCSVGGDAEYEKQIVKEFSLNKLMSEFPEIYEKCCEEKEKDVVIKNKSNDRLVITVPKEVE